MTQYLRLPDSCPGTELVPKANPLEDVSKVSNAERGWALRKVLRGHHITAAVQATCQGHCERLGWGLGLLERAAFENLLSDAR